MGHRRVSLFLWLPLLFLGGGIVHPQDITAPATTVQLPVFGVRVDPNGLFQVQLFAPPGGELFVQRALAARARLPKDLASQSHLRKVSLRRLEEAISKSLAQGKPLSDDMTYLAGLKRISYVFVLPDQQDIVLAGPAEGWIRDAADRPVGMYSGEPILLLEDLLVALRSSQVPGRQHWVGCSIGPSEESLARLHQVQKSLPRAVPQHAEAEVAYTTWQAIEEALGLANVMVFGISPKTHMAQILVEADYRMKLIAIGREPPPIEMPTFFSEMKRPVKNSLQRWWFTPDYQRLITTPDGLNLEFRDAQVQLGTEDYKIDAQGRMTKTNTNPGRASRLYSSTFTKRYAEIAERSPVFAQLRNCIDLLVAAAFISEQKSYAVCGWEPTLLLDSVRLSAETETAPTQAPFMANVAWRNRHLIAPSGGVSILANQALTRENLQVDPMPAAIDVRQGITRKLAESASWWWD